MDGDTNVTNETVKKKTNPFDPTVSNGSMTQLPGCHTNLSIDEPSSSTTTSVDQLNARIAKLEKLLSDKDAQISELKEQNPWPTTPFNEPGIPELFRQMELLREEIKKKDTKIEELKEHVLYVETETLAARKKRRLSNDELENQLSDSKDDKILQLQKANERLRKQLLEEELVSNNNQQTDTNTRVYILAKTPNLSPPPKLSF